MSVPRIISAGGCDFASGIGSSRADREWDRFRSVAVPMAGGGWRDPAEPILQRGVTAADWNALIETDARLRQRERLNRAPGGK